MQNRPIQISSQDMQRLHQVIGTATRASAPDQQHSAMLRDELDRAVIVSDDGVPSNVITMRTRVRAGQSGQYDDYKLVYPWEADVGSNRVSVSAPLGTALLGYRGNDHIQWRMPGGVHQLRVERILHQATLSQGEARLS